MRESNSFAPARAYEPAESALHQPVLDRIRPVFAFPRVARYVGQGSVDEAASFVAADPLVASPGHYDWEGEGFLGPDIARQP